MRARLMLSSVLLGTVFLLLLPGLGQADPCMDSTTGECEDMSPPPPMATQIAIDKYLNSDGSATVSADAGATGYNFSYRWRVAGSSNWSTWSTTVSPEAVIPSANPAARYDVEVITHDARGVCAPKATTQVDMWADDVCGARRVGELDRHARHGYG